MGRATVVALSLSAERGSFTTHLATLSAYDPGLRFTSGPSKGSDDRLLRGERRGGSAPRCCRSRGRAGGSGSARTASRPTEAAPRARGAPRWRLPPRPGRVPASSASRRKPPIQRGWSDSFSFRTTVAPSSSVRPPDGESGRRRDVGRARGRALLQLGHQRANARASRERTAAWCPPTSTRRMSMVRGCRQRTMSRPMPRREEAGRRRARRRDDGLQGPPELPRRRARPAERPAAGLHLRRRTLHGADDDARSPPRGTPGPRRCRARAGSATGSERPVRGTVSSGTRLGCTGAAALSSLDS